MPRSRQNKSRSTLSTWFWLLVIAPGRVVTLESPHAPDEVMRRLQALAPVARVLSSTQAVVRLAKQNNQRTFTLWIEPGASGHTQIHGQMQTPYRVAATRLLAATVLLGLSLVWFPTGRMWLGVMFLIGGVAFLLLSQYERLVGRDLRLNLDWLRSALDAR